MSFSNYYYLRSKPFNNAATLTLNLTLHGNVAMSCPLSVFKFITARKVCEGYVFTRVCQSFCSQGLGGVVSQHALQVSRPTYRGRLRGLAWGGSPGPYLEGFLTVSFTPTSKVSWKVEAFLLCMFLLLPTLREVPHGTKGTGPKFVTRPVYSRSQLRNNTNTVSVLVLLMHLFHTLYTRYAGIAHHPALQTSG